ncbi:PREDICTED: uncharacterized protein LOC106126637 [Papilio xuthus]|uniref:Uncharacterized protein LOC106126637 n=1 Tax=Papilio xuthus TaxID=66420 RepID=A0AAJ7EJL9_PAPXU|nr:PREDICTED: uncharacterized protein LOC106126637 [Papilio xuthus]
MFGIRTPDRKVDRAAASHRDRAPSPRTDSSPENTSNVRRSIGDWEQGRVEVKPTRIRTPEKAKGPAKRIIFTKDTKVVTRKDPTDLTDSTSPPKYATKLAEARACVTKAKVNLGLSRNTKTEIKEAVTQAVDRLYQIIKELESKEEKAAQEKMTEGTGIRKEQTKECAELVGKIENHARLIKENSEKMQELQSTLEKYGKQERQQQQYTYARAVMQDRKSPTQQKSLLSVVITSKDEMETGEEVLERIRKAVKAKEGGIVVENIRKAKDRKIIIGCKTEEERKQLKERLKCAEKHLNVQEVKNKDPMIILLNVFKYNSDEDIIAALKNQNKGVLSEGGDKEEKLEIVYKKKARNPLTQHVVMRVNPHIWKKLTDVGRVQIDLQRVRVEDQSPLVQCSLCLAYGHPKRLCKDTAEKCSHCGGAHKKSECEDWKAGIEPTCCNCKLAKMDKIDHNAFSQECPVRERWDSIARSSISYC